MPRDIYGILRAAYNERPVNGCRRWARGVPAVAGAVVLVAAATFQPAGLRAETIQEALASAYQNNPRLDAERARLRATDEEVPRALSGYRPRVTGSADAGVSDVKTQPHSTAEGETRPWGYAVTVSQNVFNGFRTSSAVDEAKAQVQAGRQQLRSVEHEILLAGATAFADVVRDRALVQLRESNVSVLTQELSATESRQAAREVTLTDVAQARARLARALSQLDAARGNLKSSRASFVRVVGRAPGQLVAPTPPKAYLPRAIGEALAIAERESPAVVGALYREASERHSITRIRGELLPEFRLEASYSNRYAASSQIDEQSAASLQGRLSMPLYEGGETYARVRQAKHRHISRIQEVEQARQEVTANVTQAWSRYQATRSQLRADMMQVEAARMALTGVRQEERAGQRTVLDLLNAEQELADARVQLVSTRRDVVVAAYGLIAQMGRLEAGVLELSAGVYDPAANYEEVRSRWFGVDISHADGRREAVDVSVESDPSWKLDD